MRGGGFTPAPTAMQLIPRLGYQAILKVREFSVADHCGDGISGRRVSLLRESLPSFHLPLVSVGILLLYGRVDFALRRTGTEWVVEIFKVEDEF